MMELRSELPKLTDFTRGWGVELMQVIQKHKPVILLVTAFGVLILIGILTS